MKIHQLPMGARFELEGEQYVKSGPLLATGKAGQRLIPRYAVLKPLDGQVLPAREAGEGPPLSRTRVMAALDVLCDRCRGLVPEERRTQLEAARDEFLRAMVP
ncbi:MAG: hypothetical protein JNM82_12580 [Rhodocyclaceae bacterium]|nr:hypothetical protein [Rhodocyclaceae bacterium]